MRGRAVIAMAALFCIAGASEPTDRLHNPQQEARARALFTETRCLVCQGQSIDDSDAELAGDLRHIIRGQIEAGQSDGQVREFLRARYGDFVLLRPPLSLANSLLWGAPFAVIGLGLAVLAQRRRRPQTAVDLSAEEQARLAQITTNERM